MATEKKINSRIQQKHDVAANWAKATNFIPKKGEIIIYDAEYNANGEETQAVRFKIGDGSKTVNNLPFAVIDYGSDIETLEQEVADNSTAIGKIQGAFETNGTTVKKATSAGTADKVANGLTIADATFDGSKALKIGAASGHIEITGGSAASPNYVSIGLKLGNLMPSTYNKVTVDGYGIVTGGENVDYAKKTDLPDVSGKQDKLTAGSNITISGNTISATVPTDVVKYTAQTLTDAQKSQARSNIGAGTSSFSGNYNDLTNKPTIPSAITSINGLGGGELTSPLVVSNEHSIVDGDSNSLVSFDKNSLKNSLWLGTTNRLLYLYSSAAPYVMLPSGPKKLILPSDLEGKQDKLTAGSNISILANTISATVPTKTSQLTNDSNFVKSNSGAFTGNLTADNFNSRFSLQSVPYGTAVGENADLNTVTYLVVGNYYCGADAIVSTMTNVPVKRAFMMTVYSPLGTHNIDKESTSTWVYRVRKFMTYLGEEYIQSVYGGSTAGTFTYGAWQQIAHKSDIPSVPTFSLSGTTLTITLP